MTSQTDDSLIDEDDPLGLTQPPSLQALEWLKHRELVRQQYVELFSSAPLYQARAAKDPEYWNKFSIGANNLLKPVD